MNIKEATEQIEGAIEAYLAKDDRGLYLIPFRMQRPIIMLGPPGVGKTAVVEQIADRMGINFVSYSITHHTRQSALGLPFIEHAEFEGREYSVSEYTMSEIIAAVYRAREEGGVDEGVLFLVEDFSVYYEIFRKYRDGYRVEGILDGSFDEGLMRRAQAAGLDERIAVVGLLSDALLQRVHAVVEAEEALKAVRADLLEMKLRLEKSADASEVIAKRIETIKRAQVNPRDLAGSLGDKEAVKAERLRVFGDVMRAVKRGSAESRGGFELAKRAFNEECSKQASVAKAIVDALDNAFRFLGGAFGEDGQEPLMFISKLAADPLLIRFVSNHGSDEYLKHNESMLFSERGFSLLQEIESMGELL